MSILNNYRTYKSKIKINEYKGKMFLSKATFLLRRYIRVETLTQL